MLLLKVALIVFGLIIGAKIFPMVLGMFLKAVIWLLNQPTLFALLIIAVLFLGVWAFNKIPPKSNKPTRRKPSKV